MQLKIARLIAACFALVAFALAIAVGLSAGNPADAILQRSLVALVLAFIGGSVVGTICEHLVRVTTRKFEAEAEALLAEDDAEVHAMSEQAQIARENRSAMESKSSVATSSVAVTAKAA